MSSKTIIKIIGIYSILFLSFLSLVIITSDAQEFEKAIIKMALALVVVWVIIGGGLMYLFKDIFRFIILNFPIGWKKKFFFSVLALILIEEMITTTITNLAPLFGGEVGKSFITASTNYFEVIFFHSAIMFVPFILVWTYLLSKYDFSVGQVFLLFGLLGTIGEAMLQPVALISGFWFFVYGLMVFIPTYSLPQRDNLKKPGIWAYIQSILYPLILSIPMSFFVIWLRGFFGVELLV